MPEDEVPLDEDLIELPGSIAALHAGDEPEASRETGVVRYDPVQRYLRELRHHKPLTADEERELAIRYKEDGDLEAAYKLVTSHLRLVVRIAFEFKRSWQNLLDLIQEGNVGLLLAVRKFDPYRGLRLSTYASWWIRAYILKFVLDNWRLVKVGTTNSRRKLLFNLRKEKEALQALGIDPGTKLLAERLNVSETDVIDVERSLSMADTSIETPIGGDGSTMVLGDTLAARDVPADVQLEDDQRRQIIGDKLEAFAQTLPARDLRIFRTRLVAEEPVTLQELGDEFGLTREGVRQVEKRLLARLKTYLVAELRGMTGIDVTESEPRARKGAAKPAKSAARSKPRRPKVPASAEPGDSAEPSESQAHLATGDPER